MSEANDSEENVTESRKTGIDKYKKEFEGEEPDAIASAD